MTRAAQTRTRAAKKRSAGPPATIDGRTGALDPTPRRIDLKSLPSVKREMARVYRDVRNRKLDSQEGTRLTYMLAQIGKMIEMAELEDRLKVLEAQASEG